MTTTNLDHPSAVADLKAAIATLPERRAKLQRRIDAYRRDLDAPNSQLPEMANNTAIIRDALAAAEREMEALTPLALRAQLAQARRARSDAFRRLRQQMTDPRRRGAAQRELNRWARHG